MPNNYKFNKLDFINYKKYFRNNLNDNENLYNEIYNFLQYDI